jgi:hypothetical protein
MDLPPVPQVMLYTFVLEKWVVSARGATYTEKQGTEDLGLGTFYFQTQDKIKRAPKTKAPMKGGLKSHGEVKKEEGRTIESIALCQIGVVGLGEQAEAETTKLGFEVAVINVKTQGASRRGHGGTSKDVGQKHKKIATGLSVVAQEAAVAQDNPRTKVTIDRK